MSTGAADPDRQLVARPASGRVYEGSRRVRLGDVSPAGRLRLDAAARYLQDLSSDDTTEVALPEDDSWVVRRVWMELRTFPTFRELLRMATWCSGTGGHWAERRVSLQGEHGGAVEAAVLWVALDPSSGRPRRITPDFHEVFGEAAAGRSVRARALHQSAPPAGACRRPWPLRYADFDLLRHVNNAAYWVPLEELLADRRDLRAPLRAEVEHRGALEPGAAPELVWEDRGPQGLAAWLLDGARVAATAVIAPLGAPAASAGTRA